MSEMLERCARAVHNYRSGWAGIPASIADELWIRDREWHIGEARAVLTELAKPTPEMIEAGEDAVWSDGEVLSIFTAMITAAQGAGG